MERQSSLCVTEQTKQKNNLGERFIPAFFATLLFVIYTLYIINLFKLDDLSIITIVGSWLIVTVYFILPKNRLKRRFTIMISLTLVMVLTVGRNIVMNGLFLVYNYFIEQIGFTTGRVYSQIEVQEGSIKALLSYNLFLSFLLVGLAVLSYWIVYKGRLFFLLLFYILLISYQLITSLSVNFLYEVGLLFAISSTLLYQTIDKRKEEFKRGSKKRLPVLGISLGILFIFLLCFVGLIYVIEPKTSYTKFKPVEKLEQKLQHKASNLRYAKDEDTSLTFGDFTLLRQVEQSEEPVLEIVMERPTSLYLKGFVGVDYLGDKWEDLEAATAYKEHGLFYWLEEEAFEPSCQLSYINKLTKAIDYDTYEMTVYNLKESSKLLFFPYELASSIEEVKESLRYRDTNKYSATFSGERLYKYKIMPNVVTKYPRIAKVLYSRSDKEAMSYRKAEQHYKRFVYDNYTKVPEPVSLMLEHHLKDQTNLLTDRMSYEQAIYEVKTFLQKNITYNEEVFPPEEDVDLLVHFLENKKEGYAPHYATAATLIFRFLGIPARYVEGYIVTPEDIRDIEPYEKITIPNKNAHAWTEIYIDRLGWIPIEVTPPYEDIMASIDLTDYPEGFEQEGFEAQSSQVEEAEGMQQVVTDDESGHNEKMDPESPLPLWQWILIVLAIIVIIVLLVFLVFMFIRRRKLRHYERTLQLKDEKTKVTQRFSYTVRLLIYDGIVSEYSSVYQYIPYVEERYDSNYAKLFKKALLINEKAQFSKEAITEEEVLLVEKLFTETKTKLKVSRTRWQRLKMYYIDAVV